MAVSNISYAPTYASSRGGVSVDPRLVDILTTAAAASGLNATFFSGVAGRSSGTKNHPGGHAVDLELSDPATGKAYSSYAGPAYARGVSWQQSFPVYEQFAQTARIIQQQRYPELNDTFAWGGYWYAGGGNKSGPDMMHFQVTPGAGRMTTQRAGIGGSWEGGASADFARTYGIRSNGGLSGPAGASLAAQVEGAISGGAPVGAPRIVGSDAPVPFPRPKDRSPLAELDDIKTQVLVRQMADQQSNYAPHLDENGDYVGSPNRLRGATYPSTVSSTSDPAFDVAAPGLGALADPRTAGLIAPTVDPVGTGPGKWADAAAEFGSTAIGTLRHDVNTQDGHPASTPVPPGQLDASGQAHAVPHEVATAHAAGELAAGRLDASGQAHAVPHEVATASAYARLTAAALPPPAIVQPPSDKVRVITVNPDGTQKFPLSPDERSSAVTPSVPLPRTRDASIGLVEPGNIDIQHRPVYFGNDGTYGTELSFSIGTDKGEVLIPSIVNGKKLTQAEAIAHYQQTGENLGTFKDPASADAFATQLHLRNQGLGNMPVPMPGRPASGDLQKVAPKVTAPAQAVPAPAVAPKQTIRVGKHDYVVGSTFDQGGMHYRVTEHGIEKSRIQTGEPTIMSGIIGTILKDKVAEAAPGVQRALSGAANAIGRNVSQFGSTIEGAAGSLGHAIMTDLPNAIEGAVQNAVKAKLQETASGAGAQIKIALAPIGAGLKGLLDGFGAPPPDVPPPRLGWVAPEYQHLVGPLTSIAVPKELAPTPALAFNGTVATGQAGTKAPAPVTTTESVVKPPHVVAANDQPATHAPQVKPTYTGPISITPTTKVTTRVSTRDEPNPAYATWVKQQNVSAARGSNVVEGHGAGNLVADESLQAHAVENAAAPPMTIPVTRAQRIAVAQPNLPGSGVTLRRAMTGDIPVISTVRHEAAAAAANQAAAQQAHQSSIAAQVAASQKTVQIASGKTVPVGATGEAQGGRYQYQVQADGSIVNLTTGNISAPAPSSGGGGNGVGTHWDAGSGSWQGGGQ